MQVTKTVQYQVQVNRTVQGKDGESHTETTTETRTKEVTVEVPDPPKPKPPEPDRNELAEQGRQSRMGLEATVPDASSERIRAETQKSAAEGARALREEVERTDPARRPELLERMRPTLQEIAKGANGTPDEGDRRSILRDLSRTAELAGPEGARAIAQEFASQTINQHTDVDDSDQLGGALKATLEEGASPAFARALIMELGQRPGLEEAGANVTQATVEGMRAVRADFDKTADKVDELNDRLNTYLKNLGPALSEPEQRQFIDDFKQKHPEYAQLEKDAGRLSDQLDDAVSILNDPAAPEAVKKEAEATLKELPRVGETEVGQARLRQDLLDQKAGKPSLLTAAAEIGDDAFREQVADVTTKAVASELLRAGGSPESRELIQALEGNAKLFGVDDPGRMASIVDSLQDVADGKPEAMQELNAKAEGFAKGVAARIKGMGLVANLASLVQGAGKLNEGDLLDKINAGSSILGSAGGAAQFALDALGRNARLLSKSLPIVGVVGGLAASIEDIKDGNVGKGFLNLGLTALTTAFPEVALPLAGFMLLNEAGKQHQLMLDKQDELKELLGKTSLGALKPEAMDVVVAGGDAENAGLIGRLSPYMGVSPQEGLMHLNSLDKERIDAFLAASKHVKMEPGKDTYRTAPSVTDQFMALNREAGAWEVSKRAREAWQSGEFDGRKLKDTEREELWALSHNAEFAARNPETVGMPEDRQLDHLAFDSTTGYIDFLRRRDLLPTARGYDGPH